MLTGHLAEGAGQGDHTHVGMGKLSLPLVGVLHLPMLGCRSCMSIMAHKGGDSFAKLPRDSSSQLLRCGFSLLLKANSCQVCSPPGSGTTQGLKSRAPGAAWREVLLQPSCIFHMRIHIQLGCMCYLRELTGFNQAVMMSLFGGSLNTSWGRKLPSALVSLNGVVQANSGDFFHRN